MPEIPRLRIGELSRRVGVSPELLRAWEARYALLDPERTAGGLRLYSIEDERLVLLMRRHIATGVSAAEAARLTKLGEDPGERAGAASAERIIDELSRSVAALDEPAVQAALDRLFAGLELDRALSEVVLPFLGLLGRRWEAGEITVAHEHFASNIIGGRLRALARGWGRGVGPRAVLACPPGEHHDLGLICFGLALREHGWRITYLGADTPLDGTIDTLTGLAPAIVVLSALTSERFATAAKEIKIIARRLRVAIGGLGADAKIAQRLGAELLPADPVAAAEMLAP